VEAADLVTEMTKVKHPMDAGQKGQRGHGMVTLPPGPRRGTGLRARQDNGHHWSDGRPVRPAFLVSPHKVPTRPKRRRLSGAGELVVSLPARGLTTGEIAATCVRPTVRRSASRPSPGHRAGERGMQLTS